MGVLQAAGLLFFAFAGYARIATLGEEVRDPARTIPRAVPLALGIVVVVYALVGVSVLLVLGADGTASSIAPLQDAVRAGSLRPLAPLVQVGAIAASLGALLSVMAGVGRTALAMARDRELPGVLAAVHPRFAVPHHAELLLGVVVIAIVSVADIRGAIGFSSTGVLVYYAIANASAWTLPGRARHWRRPVTALGLIGCLVLVATLPIASVLIGLSGASARTPRSCSPELAPIRKAVTAVAAPREACSPWPPSSVASIRARNGRSGAFLARDGGRRWWNDRTAVARLIRALVQPQRWILISHQHHIRNHPVDPAVQPITKSNNGRG